MAKQTTELTEAARLLSQAATSLINSPLGLIQNGATSRESNDTSRTTTTTTTTVAPQHTTIDGRSTRARDEFRRLFAPYHTQSSTSTSRFGPSTSFQRRASCTPARQRTKKKKTKKDVTVKFFCLASTTQHNVSNCEEKQHLLVAGLGEKKVSLPVVANANDLTIALKETYPKLQDSGGYELLHTRPSSRELNLIHEGEKGYTIDFLKRFVGQGRVYIRPIQCDLDLTVMETSKNREFEQVAEMCIKCLNIFPMNKLRETFMYAGRVTTLQPLQGMINGGYAVFVSAWQKKICQNIPGSIV